MIKTIEFYSNSKYLNGDKDELGRDKPFYNIVNGMVDVEKAAKDIDTKDIQATSDDGEHYTESFLMSKDIYEWMKETNFAKTLNEMNETHSRYGSLLVKKCLEKNEDGEKILKIELPEWKNVMTDQIDIANGVIVETHYMLPTEIMKMSEWKNKKEAIKLGRTENEKNYNGKRIPVHEVRGEFPKDFIGELESENAPSPDPDTTEFSYQLYYLAGDIGGKLVPLYWEDDTEKVYKYLPRKKKSGRSFGVGVVEEGEEPQVWTNDAVLKQYRALEYTSKAIGQSASKKLKGRNLLTEVDDGTILEHEDGKPITPVQLLPSGGLAQYQNLITQWYSQFERASSAYAAQRGETPPSGTPFRLQAAILQQSGGVFDDLQEDLGNFIIELFNEKGWILDHLAKKLNTKHILSHEFSLEELKEIDRNFSSRKANDEAIDQILNKGEPIQSIEQYEQFRSIAEEFIKQTKNHRFLDVPEDYYKKFKAKITINVTGEQKNKAAVLESLINIMTVYAKNPQLAQDPVLAQIFMKIVELSGAGISPVSLMGAIEEQAKMREQQAMEQQMAPEEQGQPQEMSLSANPVPNVA